MGPHRTSMLLFALCVILLISNSLLLRQFRHTKMMLDRYDALVKQYGGLDMALAQLTRKQVLALISSSAIGLSTLTGCEPEVQSQYDVQRVPIVRDRSAYDSSDKEPDARLNAAAASMLLGMHGIEVAEDELYLSMCLASSADGVAEAMRQYIPTEYTCVALHDCQLLYLPGPSIVWVDAVPVVFVYADEGQVQAWEVADGGLESPTIYGFSDFERRFSGNAVYISNRGYTPIT